MLISVNNRTRRAKKLRMSIKYVNEENLLLGTDNPWSIRVTDICGHLGLEECGESTWVRGKSPLWTFWLGTRKSHSLNTYLVRRRTPSLQGCR